MDDRETLVSVYVHFYTCIYIYMTCTFVCVYVYTCIYVHVLERVCGHNIHTYIPYHIYIHTHIHIHIFMHTCTQLKHLGHWFEVRPECEGTETCLFIYTHIHTYIHTYMHAYIHTFTYIHIHTYIRAHS